MGFAAWYKEVCEELIKSRELKELECQFLKKHNDIERVEALITSDVVFKKPVSESFTNKNNQQSELYRSTGNKLYANSSFDLALKSYTRAIKLAESGSKSLSLGYANRSAVLFALKKFNLCENDIQLCLDIGYPAELQYKVFERVAKCYMELSLFEKSKSSFNKSLESLKFTKLDLKQIEAKKAVLLEMISKCPDRQDNINLDNSHLNCLYSPQIPTIEQGNNTYLSASRSFTMQSDKIHGRYAVAAEDINAGDIILVEKPFASVCLPECYETHCYHCLARFFIGHPCRSCSTVLYCSTECERRSWQDSHKHECSFLNVLNKEDIGLGHLALHVVLRNSFIELKKFDEDFNTRDNEFGLNKMGLYAPDDYICLYSLVGNSNLRNPSDLFKRSIMAVYLAKIVSCSSYVPNEQDALITVASHLLKQIQMLPCNAHEISEAQLDGSDVASNQLKEVGSAAYTSLSLLNHSCDPSVVRHCYKDTCVVRALKHIKKGQEIIDNYGFLYAVEEKQDRIKHLVDQYYFTCQCTPCQENWPLYTDLPDETPNFLCQKCRNPIKTNTANCSICRTEDPEIATYYNYNWQSKYQTAIETVLKEQDIDENLKFLLQYLDLLTKKAKLPTIHVNNCQEIVKLCFSLSANFVRL